MKKGNYYLWITLDKFYDSYDFLRYSEFYGFRSKHQDDYFRVNFDHFRSKLNFLRQLGH